MDNKQLLTKIGAADALLAELRSIPYDGLSETIVELGSMFNEFKSNGQQLLEENDTLQVGIVGQVKAGKSTFLSSLFFDGEDVLPAASTPMTAGLTIIEYADNNTFEVEYFSEQDWDVFVNQDATYKAREKEVIENNPGAPEHIIRRELQNRTTDKVRAAHEIVSNCTAKAKQKIGSKPEIVQFDDLEDLQNVLEQFVGAHGEYTSVVKSLYIKKNDDRLKGLRIVDTPGVNDPVVSREQRTRMFLGSCHGVFLLSASSDFMGSGDVGFLNTRIGGSGIGTVVILASKFDAVLIDIGAGHEMKQEQGECLDDAVREQTRKFKRRLRDLTDSISEKLRGRLKLDTTASIGFSISHKPVSKWNEIENTAIAQMKRFYPDDFASETDVVNAFNELANMDNIREKYLEGVFMSNKERIISEKIQAFFDLSRMDIVESVEKSLTDFTNRQDQLNETTIAEIQRQKEMQHQLFDDLRDSFNHIFASFARSMQIEVRSIGNSLLFEEVRQIPIETTSGPITVKGMLWGHNTNEMLYDQVDTTTLCSMIDSSVEKYAKCWNEAWKEMFRKVRSELEQELNDKISEFEGQIMSTSFNDRYYRNLISRVLDQMRDNQELSIGDLIVRYQQWGDDIANKQFEPTGTDDYKEEHVGSYLTKQLRDHNAQLIKELRNLASALKTEVQNQIQTSLDESVALINDMKSSFADQLQKEGEDYLNNLEKDLLKKTEVLKQINAIVDTLGRLKTIFL